MYMRRQVGSDRVSMWHWMQGSARKKEWTLTFISLSQQCCMKNTWIEQSWTFIGLSWWDCMKTTWIEIILSRQLNAVTGRRRLLPTNGLDKRLLSMNLQPWRCSILIVMRPWGMRLHYVNRVGYDCELGNTMSHWHNQHITVITIGELVVYR